MRLNRLMVIKAGVDPGESQTWAARTRRVFATRRHMEQICLAIGFVLIAVGLMHLIPALIYPRPWFGPLSWRKPITFGLSFGTVLISVVWVSSYLRIGERVRAIVLGVLAADSIVEVAGISIQAWRHVPSHLNTESGFDTSVAFTLDFGGAVLIATLGALAVPAIRGQSKATPSMRLALRAGFGLLLAGLASGIAMIARGEQLIHTASRTAAYDGAGFLKLFHAVSLHAVLALPAVAWVLSKTRRDQAKQYRLVGMAVGAYVVVAVVTFVVCLVSL
jgi:hypothetical protein